MATEPNKWKDKFEAGETNLAGANFCYITLTDADFSKCNLDGATFVGATLVNCKFSSVEVDWLGKVTKEGTTASLKRTNFEGATLTNANFVKACLDTVNFEKATCAPRPTRRADLVTRALLTPSIRVPSQAG